MGERTVLNRYYPLDFDRGQPKNQKVRMMLPMSIRCNTCFSYIHKGSKFNSRMEVVIGETYLGIQIFRFYFKCTKCLAEITLKTDPQNSDYVVESGAARNFEPWCDEEEAAKGENKKREAEEMGDARKSLEIRTMNSYQYMDIRADLEEVMSMKVLASCYTMHSHQGRGERLNRCLLHAIGCTLIKDVEKGLTETPGGSSILKPKFILRPRSATKRVKKRARVIWQVEANCQIVLCLSVKTIVMMKATDWKPISRSSFNSSNFFSIVNLMLNYFSE